MCFVRLGRTEQNDALLCTLKSASEMTCVVSVVSGEALNSTHSLTAHSNVSCSTYCSNIPCVCVIRKIDHSV